MTKRTVKPILPDRFLFILLIWATCVLTVFPLYPVDFSTLSGKVPVTGEWRMNISDSHEYRNPDFDDSGWQKITLPYIPPDEAKEPVYFWIRTSFRVEKILPDKKVFFIAGKIDAAMEIYCNGVMVGFFGNFPPDFRKSESGTKQVLVPNDLIRIGMPNVISIRFYNNAGIPQLPVSYFSDYSAFLVESELMHFLSVRIYLVYSIFCFILGIYYLIQFAYRKKERTNLHFSLTNFCFSIYFLNMGLDVTFFPYKLAGAISQSFLPFFFGFLTLFFVNFFNIHNNKIFKRIIIINSVVFASLFYFNMGEKDIIPGLFNIALAPSGLQLVFMVYLSIRATIVKKPDALPIMIGALIGFFLGIHDMAYQFAGARPLIWFQGTGIFCFNMSMFIATSLRSIKAYNSLEIYSADIVRKSEELEKYISNINEMSETIAGISNKLEISILITSESIEKMATGSSSIFKGMNNQFGVVTKTNETIMGLLNSLEIVYDGLNQQFANVQETSATIEEMIGNIGEITKNLKNTSDFAEELKTITRKGEEIMTSSSKSIREIINVTEDAHKIIDTVSDLAEQTNILAINAAIEAAHAGQYGIGFAVVAGEIKRLASGSTQRSSDILLRINEIVRKIEQGVADNSQVKEVFDIINAKTSSAANQIQSIYSAILDQQTASEQVLHLLSRLNDTSREIRMHAEAQESGSKMIKSDVEMLVDSSKQVLSTISAISDEIGEVVRSTNSIKSIAGESTTLIAKLRQLLDKK